MTKRQIINRILSERHNHPRRLGSLGRAMRAYALAQQRVSK